MRDLTILWILIACVPVAFYRPWLGLLALAVFGYMHPQGYASGFMHVFPVYKVLFGAVVVALLLNRQWRLPPRDWRVPALIVLWAFFLFTTYHAKVQWAAWPRFGEISSIFLMVGLTLLLIDSRRKLFFLIATISLSFALVTIKGGYWAVMTGFADRVYGPPDSQYYDNNMFAVVVIMNIPLLVLWLRETHHQALRYALMAAIALSGAAALSSWSRGALVTLGATMVVMLWFSKRKYLTIPLLAGSIALATVALPEAWFARMDTIVAHEHEASAQSRLHVWQVGIKHAQEFPVTGVGADGWHYAVVTMDWHNSYVEMMAEHGFIAFGIWCLLLFGTMASLIRLGWRAQRSPELGWITNYSQMLTASFVAYACGSLFLGLSYWDILYQLIAVAILLSEIARKAGRAVTDQRAPTAVGASSERVAFSLSWGILLMLALSSTFVPTDTSGRIDASRWLEAPLAYFSSLPTHFYQLIKTAILWAPVGFLYTVAGGSRVIKTWALPVIFALVVAALATLPDPVGEIIFKALYAIPGLALGMWVAGRTVVGLPTVKSEATSPMGMAISTPQAESEVRRIASEPSIIPPASTGSTRLTGRVVALLLVVLSGLSLFEFPTAQVALAVGFIIYSVLLWRLPSAWLVIVPAALPLLDLAHWTGHFFWDEFDLLMLVTLAVALWQGRFRLAAWAVPKLGGLLGLFVLVWLVSVLVGLLPIQPLDANAFSAYWSHYNSLRLGKGLLWGLVFFGLFRSQPGDAGAFTKLSIGMAIGVLGVSLWALWEQLLFAGTVNTADYRVTAGFSSMHTGGGHFEAYLVIALPFVWGLFFQLRNLVYRGLLGAVFLLGAYAMFSTVARGGLIALGISLLILVSGTWLVLRKQSLRRTGMATPVAMGVLTLVVMVAGMSSVFWKHRIEQTGADAGIRFRHWADVLDMRDSGVLTTLFGQGLGSLPATNLATQLPDNAGSYRYVSEGGNTYLALNSAGTLYMAQRVAPHPSEMLRLEVSVRAPKTQAGLEASLCEKILFNSRTCQWMNVDVKPGGQEWQSRTQTFNSGEVGVGNALTSRPVQFSLYNPSPGTVIEVDNVRLLDARGQDLLKNGDFTRGGDFWFFKSGDHLFWHAKNLWVHLLFEQGWLGMTIFTLILVLALVRLARKLVAGELEATVLLASMGAWVIVGGVDSLVDAPRIALLLYGTLFIGASWGAVPHAHIRKTKRRHRRGHRDQEVVT